MALPVFRAAGAKANDTTNAVAVLAPTGVATGDLEILIAECPTAATVSITANGGGAWTAVTGTPITVTAGEKLYVWYRVRAGGDSNPSVQASADHVCAGRLAYQTGTFNTIDPLEVETTGTHTTSNTTFSFAPGVSTAGTDRLVLCIASILRDSNTGSVPVCTNASLSSLASRLNICTNSGLGGGFGVTEGARAAAGSVGTFACTYAAASTKSMIAFAIKPLVSLTLTADVGTFAHTGIAAGFLRPTRIMTADVGAFALTGIAATLRREPITLSASVGAFTLTGNAATLTYTPSGPSGPVTIFLTNTALTEWEVPADWNNTDNSVECIAGGGGGADGLVSPGNVPCGGGGGAWSKGVNLTLTPESVVDIQIGAGGAAGSDGEDTWFNGTSLGGATVSAERGYGAVTGLVGAGGSYTNGNGSGGKSSGGTGGGSSGTFGGGGGGGGGAGGINGDGANGGLGEDTTGNGGGGGGANAGVNGYDASSGSSGGAGGDGPVAATGGSGGGSFGDGGDGTLGAGGGGMQAIGYSAGDGGAGVEWTTHGSGGGGGGGGPSNQVDPYNVNYGGRGGLYGGGGGGDPMGAQASAADFAGAQGIIVIIYTPAEVGETLTADVGAFALTGNAAGLLRARRLTADVGAFALTGNVALLQQTHIMAADVGAFALTGNAATLTEGIPPDLLNENFEGTGIPPSWEYTGTVDWDSTTSPLEGAQSCRINRAAGASQNAFRPITPSDEVWGHFMFRAEQMPGTWDYILDSFDTDFNNPFRLRLQSGGQLTIIGLGINVTTSAALSVSTNYHIWWRYKKGTGANAVAEVWFATTNARPSSSGSAHAGVTNGTGTAALNYISLGGQDAGSGTGVIGHWDTVQAATTDIYGGAVSYTLTADVGAFALTGNDATLRLNQALSAATGTFALTGNDATLRLNQVVSASAGAFVLTGNDASLRQTQILTSETGAFVLTGNAATLIPVRKLTAATGAFALTGNVADLRQTSILRSDAGPFTYTGNNNNFLLNQRLTCAAGAFVLTGNAAPLSAGKNLVAGTGAFALAGQDVAFRLNQVVTAAAGSFALTGNAAGLARSFTLTASSGAFVLTGNAAALQQTHIGVSATGAFVLTGNDAGKVRAYVVAAGTGSFALTGNDATLVWAEEDTLIATVGVFLLTGNDAILAQTSILGADTGTFTLTGNSATLRRGSSLTSATGSFILTGNDVAWLRSYVFSAATGTFSLTGNAATLSYAAAGALPATVGIFLLTGNGASLLFDQVLDATTKQFLFSGKAADLRHAQVLSAGLGQFVLTGGDAKLFYFGAGAPVTPFFPVHEAVLEGSGIGGGFI